MGSLRVGHDWSDAAAAAFAILTGQTLNIAPIWSSRLKINSLPMPLLFLSWRMEWRPTPVFLPGEFHGQRSLASYSTWGHKESDITEQLTLFILNLVCVCVCVCVICHITPQWSDFTEGYDIYLNSLVMIYPSFIISLGISYPLWFSGFINHSRKSLFEE